ncbi:MAG: response regulator transcription factor [Bordetella sp.]|nr:response regulator transcription factor [Bordetella sp.]
MKINLIDDNQAWADRVREALAAMGHEIDWFASCFHGLTALRQQQYDVLIADTHLPDGDVQAQLANIRFDHPTIGIITLSMQRDAAVGVASLGDGADYHLTKPLDMPMLEANMVALQRRMNVGPHVQGDEPRWRLSLIDCALTDPDRSFALSLTEKEARMIFVMLISPGLPVSHQRLSEFLGDAEQFSGRHRIDVQMHRLRRKLAQLPGTPFVIKNFYSKGFMLLSPRGARCQLVTGMDQPC